jgi:hypothetical protein
VMRSQIKRIALDLDGFYPRLCSKPDAGGVKLSMSIDLV